MLDEYFRRQDVQSFIKELESNPKYLTKSVHEDSKYGMQINDELALYLFYDILFKYKIIIDDKYLFPDFLFQIERLFRKMDYFDDMIQGVNRLLIGLVETILDVKSEDRDEIVRYFYQKYIMDGYFVHGYNTTYEEFIKGRDFVPEKYPNLYPKMIRVKQIFEKYKIQVMNKTFQENEVSFTDDLVMACHYSVISPGYFYELISTCSNDGSCYRKQDYSSAMSCLKRFMSNHSFSARDQGYVLNVFDEEWKFIHRVPRKISLLFVKRSMIMKVDDKKLQEYLNSDKSTLSIVEKILMPRYSSVFVEKALKYGEYQMISLNMFYNCCFLNTNAELPIQNELGIRRLLNSYGIISILLIVGSLLISLGVIITIIFIVRGI